MRNLKNYHPTGLFTTTAFLFCIIFTGQLYAVDASRNTISSISSTVTPKTDGTFYGEALSYLKSGTNASTYDPIINYCSKTSGYVLFDPGSEKSMTLEINLSAKCRVAYITLLSVINKGTTSWSGIKNISVKYKFNSSDNWTDVNNLSISGTASSSPWYGTVTLNPDNFNAQYLQVTFTTNVCAGLSGIRVWGYPYKTLTINNNNGTTETKEGYVSATNRITDPTKPGYTFTGWTGTGISYLTRVQNFECANSTEVSFNGTKYVNLGRAFMFTDEITINLWAYMDNWSEFTKDNMRLYSCTQSGGWNIEPNSNGYVNFACYDSGVGYKSATSTTTFASLTTGWHLFTLVFDGTKVQGYIDNSLKATGSNFTSGKIGYHDSNAAFIGAEAGTDDTPVGNYFKGKIKNFGICNGAFSADQISNYLWSKPDETRYYYKENATITANYTANKYTVTLDRQSGSGGSSSCTATYDAAMPSITLPTHPNGYAFAGYFTAVNGGGTQYYNADGTSTRTWNIDANTTLYAKWTYTITYNGNGATGGSTASSSHIYNIAKALTTNGFTRTGYTFSGWNTAANGSGTSYTNGQSVTNLTVITLYAQWNINTYTLSIAPNGGSYNNISTNQTFTQNYNTTKEISKPLRTGYVFKGWSGTGEKWLTRAQYQDCSQETVISFNGSSNYISLGTRFKFEDAITINTWAYMANWSEFTTGNMRLYSCTEGGGWNIEPNGTNGYVNFACYDSGVGYKSATSTTTFASLTTGWHLFTLAFDGTKVKGYIDNSLKATGSNFTSGKIGYHASNAVFIGAEAGTDDTPVGNYFKGKIKNFAICNHCLNATEIASLYDNQNTTIYWHGAENTTITANWMPATYTVTYNGNGATGGSTASSSHTYDVAKPLTTNGFTYGDYTFVGWSTSAEGDVLYTDGQSVSNLTSAHGGTVTLYAKWAKAYRLYSDGTTDFISNALSFEGYFSLYHPTGNTLKLQRQDEHGTWWNVRTITYCDYTNTVITASFTYSDKTMSDIAKYTGNFYVRADATTGGWSDYLNVYKDNKMGQLSANKYYWAKQIPLGAGETLSVKAQIGNIYNPCISDTMFKSTDLTNTSAIRYNYDRSTNVLTAYQAKGKTTKIGDLSATIAENMTDTFVVASFINNSSLTSTADVTGFNALNVTLSNSSVAGQRVRIVHNFYTDSIIYQSMPNNVSAEINAVGDLVISATDASTQELSKPFSITNGRVIYERVFSNNKIWYWISFPYDVKIADVKGIPHYGTAWIVKYYNTQKRANLTGNLATYWEYLPETATLNANEGYLLGFENNYPMPTTLQFPSALCQSKTTFNSTTSVTLPNYTGQHADAPFDANWHLVGTPVYLKSKVSGPNYIVTIKGNNTGYIYSNQASATDLNPFNSFFVQYSGTETFTKQTAQSVPLMSTKATDEADEFYTLVMSNGTYTEKAGIILADDGKNDVYEQNKDLLLMAPLGSAYPQLFTYGASNRKMAFNHLAKATQTTVAVGLYVGTAAEYTFSLENKEVPALSVILRDNLRETETNLLYNNYTFDATTGTTSNRFELIINRAPDIHTGVLNTTNNELQFVQQDGVLTISGAEAGTPVRLFDMAGRCIYVGKAKTTITIPALSNGIYTAIVGTQAHKIVIK